MPKQAVPDNKWSHSCSGPAAQRRLSSVVTSKRHSCQTTKTRHTRRAKYKLTNPFPAKQQINLCSSSLQRLGSGEKTAPVVAKPAYSYNTSDQDANGKVPVDAATLLTGKPVIQYSTSYENGKAKPSYVANSEVRPVLFF